MSFVASRTKCDRETELKEGKLEISEIKYSDSVECINDTMDRKNKERIVQGRRTVGELGSIVRKNSTAVKRDLRKRIIFPTLIHGSEP